MEKHGPYQSDDLILNPVGWAAVTGHTHCEFFLPKAEILPGACIRSRPGDTADIYCLKDHETLYYYHTSWHAAYVENEIRDIISAEELESLEQYMYSATTKVKLC